MQTYKVIETSIVTDEELEKIINQYVSLGWNFNGIQFAIRESSKRPAMAFVLFVRDTEDSVEQEGFGGGK